tara:strand:- start:287 stop:1381 length:1095 start_codon:yes stop_codon:yes gene_type:complete
MCGLVGCFGDIDLKIESLFENLLIIDALRGPHSTGVALVSKPKAAPYILKGVMSPISLLSHSEYMNRTKEFQHLMMGHNRFATKGDVVKKNAHPFRHNHITLTHNGTVHHTKPLELDKTFETDSETITYSISKVGIDKTWENLNGAAMLVWWDRKEQTLNFISNEKRPFHFVYTKDKDCLMWASEFGMLHFTLKRNDIPFHDNQIYYPEKNELFTCKYDGDKIIQTRRMLKEYKYVGYTQPQNNWWDKGNPEYYGDRSGFHQRRNKRAEKRTTRKQQAAVIKLYPSSDLPLLLFNTDEKDLISKTLSEKNFKNNHYSCVICSAYLNPPIDYKDAIMLDINTVVCGPCEERISKNHLAVSKGIIA